MPIGGCSNRGRYYSGVMFGATKPSVSVAPGTTTHLRQIEIEVPDE